MRRSLPSGTSAWQVLIAPRPGKIPEGAPDQGFRVPIILRRFLPAHKFLHPGHLQSPLSISYHEPASTVNLAKALRPFPGASEDRKPACLVSASFAAVGETSALCRRLLSGKMSGAVRCEIGTMYGERPMCANGTWALRGLVTADLRRRARSCRHRACRSRQAPLQASCRGRGRIHRNRYADARSHEAYRCAPDDPLHGRNVPSC